jgi:NAD(P)-dependent dehydrogenase (short-subunit alcohol dehydrogenase family)
MSAGRSHLQSRSHAQSLNSDPLAGRRIFVTGGTSGLGFALVRAAHARGARVGFVARTAAAVDSVAGGLPGSVGIVGDVAEKTAIHRIALQAAGRLGGLDVLINNASSLGPVPLAPLADTECEALEQALATNLVGPFRLTRALLGALAASAREGTGAVVLNVSSDAAVQPYPGWGAYGASKAGLRHLSEIWDQELRELGIRVLSVDPGDMDTPLHALAVPDADRTTLKDPAVAAEEVLGVIASTLAALGGSHPERSEGRMPRVMAPSLRSG